MSERTHCLYRHFDEQGALLYVGISLSVAHRLKQHAAASHWFDRIATVTIERFASREAALDAELRAIHDEAPAWNLLGNPRRREVALFGRTRAAQAAAESALSLLQQVVQFKPVYEESDAAALIGVTVERLRAMFRDREIGYVELPANRRYGRKRRGVTGWQFIEYFEHLQIAADESANASTETGT